VPNGRQTILTLLRAARAGKSKEPPQQGGLDFFIPPPWAIAHHLIKAWASRPTPWFPSRM